jgi:hypothetical protein
MTELRTICRQVRRGDGQLRALCAVRFMPSSLGTVVPPPHPRLCAFVAPLALCLPVHSSSLFLFCSLCVFPLPCALRARACFAPCCPALCRPQAFVLLPFATLLRAPLLLPPAAPALFRQTESHIHIHNEVRCACTHAHRWTRRRPPLVLPVDAEQWDPSRGSCCSCPTPAPSRGLVLQLQPIMQGSGRDAISVPRGDRFPVALPPPRTPVAACNA